jgi:hypothetical protein
MDELNSDAGKQAKVDKALDKPFFTFSMPYVNYVQRGAFFSLFYYIMAVINVIFPFYILGKAIDLGVFKGPARMVFAFIFSWLVIVFASWIGMQISLNGRKRTKVLESSEFVAIPMFADIFQTLGEWLGTFIGIIGAGVGIIATLFLGDESRYLFQAIGLNSFAIGGLIIIVGPVIGFFIIILFRVIAEQTKLFVAFVNNTKEIAKNIKEK